VRNATLPHLQENQRRTFRAALKWYLGLRGAILSLERSLNRRPLTPENESSGTYSTVANPTSIECFSAWARRRNSSGCFTFGTARGERLAGLDHGITRMDKDTAAKLDELIRRQVILCVVDSPSAQAEACFPRPGLYDPTSRSRLKWASKNGSRSYQYCDNWSISYRASKRCRLLPGEEIRRRLAALCVPCDTGGAC